MKKNYFVLFVLILTAIFSTSCSDDDNWSENEKFRISKVYRGDNLEVLLNEQELGGRRVLFIAKDLQTADISLVKVIPGEDSLAISNVTLEPLGTTKGHYSFAGQISDDYRTVDLEGQIVENKMTIKVNHTIVGEILGKWVLKPFSSPQGIMFDIAPKTPDATIDLQGIMGYGITSLTGDGYTINTFMGTLGLFAGFLNLEFEFEDNGNMMIAWKPSSLIPLPAGSYSGEMSRYNIDESNMYLSIALDSIIVDLIPKDILTGASLTGALTGSLANIDISELDIQEILSLVQKAYTGLPIQYTISPKGKKKNLALHIPKEHLLPILKIAVPLLTPKLKELDWKSINDQAGSMGLDLGLSAEAIEGLLNELVRVMDESPKFDFVLNLESK